MSALSLLFSTLATARRLALRSLLALIPALLCASPAHAAGLNDTGITDCSNDTVVDNTSGLQADTGSHPRQDCRYGRDPAAAAGMAKLGTGGKGFDFTKIANNGTVLPASAVLGSGPTDWACTQDNVTKLIWEVKTPSGLRSQSHSYTWYNADATSNGGNVGTLLGGVCATAGRCDTEKFVQDVNAAGLCGSGAAWRMPTVKELEGIADLGRIYPAIDPTYFPNTPASDFWSASADANYSYSAWYVNFGGGFANNSFKYGASLVRLVRAGQ